MVTRKLTRSEVPDGSTIAVFSDVHIPHHDEHALRLAVEACEKANVTHVFLNGDIADCGPASRHPAKKAAAVIDEGCLRESVASGLWFYEWARNYPCWYVFGNHEAWVTNYIKQSPELKGSTAIGLLGLWEDGDGWEVLPPLARIRLGNFNWEHGDGFFKKDGGQNPGQKIKTMAPDQTTHIGHLHRKFALFWSSPDEYGNHRTRAARGNGHMSLPEAHEDYAGTYVNWQKSFEISRVWYDGKKPRLSTDQPEIHSDRYGRPVLEYNGKVHR